MTHSVDDKFPGNNHAEINYAKPNVILISEV